MILSLTRRLCRLVFLFKKKLKILGQLLNLANQIKQDGKKTHRVRPEY